MSSYPSPQPNATGNITAQGTSSATTNCTVSIHLPANASGVAAVVSGTFSATLVPEQSADNGVTWISAGASFTGVGTTSYILTGMTDFRIRCSAFTSGTANVILNPSTAPNLGFGTGVAAIVAATAAINTTETIVVQTQPLPANRLVVGTTIRVTLQGTCNASVANASSFKIRMGTAGTTSDGLVATVNTPNSGTGGSAVAFEAVLDLTVATTGSGTNGTAVGTLQVFSVTTGIIATVAAHGQLTMSGFDTTVPNQIISISYVSAAVTTTSTFQQGYIEFVYR